MTTTKKTSKRSHNKNDIAPLRDDFGHLQPQAVELEQSVLGAIMIEKDAYYRISEILHPESFYEKRHQRIFEAIRGLIIEDNPVDLLTVSQYLERSGYLEDVGGAFYVAQLTSMIQSSAHLEYHARIIAQKSTARQLITYSSGIQKKAFDPTTDVDELMQEAEGKLFELSQKNLNQDFMPIGDVILQAEDMIKNAAARTQEGGISGIASGFSGLDKITAGWQNSDLVIVAARPAMGKTAFALSMLKNIAIDSKLPVAFFSLEMANVQLVNRLISNVCEIESEKLRTGALEPYEWGQLDAKKMDLTEAKVFLDDTPQLSVFELRTKARRLVREHGIRIIMIDYLQLMTASGMSFGSRQEEVSTISRSLKGLAKELNIPIIALSQLNRGLEGRESFEGKRPILSDLRESGAIEQDADMVLFVHRPEYYHLFEDPNGRDMRGKAEIIMAKHRNGGLGIVTLDFKGQFTRFQDEEASNTPSDDESISYASKIGQLQSEEIQTIQTDEYPF